jgi:hypothetical protein
MVLVSGLDHITRHALYGGKEANYLIGSRIREAARDSGQVDELAKLELMAAHAGLKPPFHEPWLLLAGTFSGVSIGFAGVGSVGAGISLGIIAGLGITSGMSIGSEPG